MIPEVNRLAKHNNNLFMQDLLVDDFLALL